MALDKEEADFRDKEVAANEKPPEKCGKCGRNFVIAVDTTLVQCWKLAGGCGHRVYDGEADAQADADWERAHPGAW